MCGVCGWLQELDLSTICDEQTVRWLKTKVSFATDSFLPYSFLQKIKKIEEQYKLQERFEKIKID